MAQIARGGPRNQQNTLLYHYSPRQEKSSFIATPSRARSTRAPTAPAKPDADVAPGSGAPGPTSTNATLAGSSRTPAATTKSSATRLTAPKVQALGDRVRWVTARADEWSAAFRPRRADPRRYYRPPSAAGLGFIDSAIASTRSTTSDVEHEAPPRPPARDAAQRPILAAGEAPTLRLEVNLPEVEQRRRESSSGPIATQEARRGRRRGRAVGDAAHAGRPP